MSRLTGLLLCLVVLFPPWGCNGPGNDRRGYGADRDSGSTDRARWSPDFPVERLQGSSRVDGRLDVPLERNWRYILIHHSGGPSGSEAAFDRMHREERGWKGIGYDFVIGNGRGSPDGRIEVTFRWEKQQTGAHAGVDLYNRSGIGICLVGDFSEDHPTDRQMNSLVALVSYLQDRCGIPATNVLLHRHVKPTKCPGDNFPHSTFLEVLQR